MSSTCLARRRSTPRLLFVVTEDWYFMSHRLHLAQAAMAAGFSVGVVTRVSTLGRTIENFGITLFNWRIRRRSYNPFAELRAIGQLIAVYRRFKPDIVHHVALKPVIYGALAGSLAHVDRMVQALGGLGFVFTSRRLSARILRPVVKTLYSAALAGKNTRLIIQNRDDAHLLTRAGVIHRDRIRLIRGSGVDTDVFAPSDELAGPPMVMLPSRLLWDKGIGDFVRVAKIVKAASSACRFVLVGDPDDENPSSVPVERVKAWCREGIVEWWGRREDMPTVLPRAHIICLPSYREGLPKVLLEAASCARPIVTYDVPGCREAVKHGRNGFLVPFQRIDRFAETVQQLLADCDLRRRMGKAGRERVLENFSQEMVASQTLEVYRELLH